MGIFDDVANSAKRLVRKGDAQEQRRELQQIRARDAQIREQQFENRFGPAPISYDPRTGEVFGADLGGAVVGPQVEFIPDKVGTGGWPRPQSTHICDGVHDEFGRAVGWNCVSRASLKEAQQVSGYSQEELHTFALNPPTSAPEATTGLFDGLLEDQAEQIEAQQRAVEDAERDRADAFAQLEQRDATIKQLEEATWQQQQQLQTLQEQQAPSKAVGSLANFDGLEYAAAAASAPPPETATSSAGPVIALAAAAALVLLVLR